VCYDSFTRDVIHSYVCHDSFTRDMTRSYVWHGSYIFIRYGMGGVDAIVEKLPEIVRQQIPEGAGVLLSHVPRIKESCLTYSWHISRIIDAEHILSSSVRSLKALEFMGYVPTYEWVILPIIVAEHILSFRAHLLRRWCVCVCVCVNHVPHMNESCRTHVFYIWMSHVCRTHVSSHGVIACVTWHIHLYAWHGTYIREKKSYAPLAMTHWYAWHGAFVYVIWRMHNMAHS